MMSVRTAAALVGTLLVAGMAAVINGSAALHAQEAKPVPKDSVRVLVRGCTKGYVFTAALGSNRNRPPPISAKACICA